MLSRVCVLFFLARYLVILLAFLDPRSYRDVDVVYAESKATSKRIEWRDSPLVSFSDVSLHKANMQSVDNDWHRTMYTTMVPVRLSCNNNDVIYSSAAGNRKLSRVLLIIVSLMVVLLVVALWVIYKTTERAPGYDVRTTTAESPASMDNASDQHCCEVNSTGENKLATCVLLCCTFLLRFIGNDFFTSER